MRTDALIIDLYDELETLPHLVGLLGRPCHAVGSLWAAMLAGSTVYPGIVFGNLSRAEDLEMVRRIRAAAWGGDVFIVGVAEASMRSAVLAGGCDAHLGKPVRFLRLKPLLDARPVSDSPRTPVRPAAQRGVRTAQTVGAVAPRRTRAVPGSSTQRRDGQASLFEDLRAKCGFQDRRRRTVS